MAADIGDIMAGIQTRLATLSGLHAHAEQPETVLAPAAWPTLTGVEYDESFEGSCTLTFDLWIAAAPVQVGYSRGLRLLWPYLEPSGAGTIKAAIEADVTLGGKAEGARVGASAEIDSYAFGAVEFWGAKLTLEVVA